MKDNQGEEETTVIKYLGLFGCPLDTIKMEEYQRVSVVHLRITIQGRRQSLKSGGAHNVEKRASCCKFLHNSHAHAYYVNDRFEKIAMQLHD